jgi:choline kinase
MHKERCRQAVILAAGEGKRLWPLTRTIPKCMVRVGKKSILNNQLDILYSMEITDLVIVSGHLAHVLRAETDSRMSQFQIDYVHNEAYRFTNNIYSLYLAREHIMPPFILLESDLYVDPEVLTPLIEPDIMVVARYTREMNGTVVEMTPEGYVRRLILGRDQTCDMRLDDYFKTVNFHSFSEALWREAFRPSLERYIERNKLNDYYEAALGDEINAGRVRLRGLDITGARWWEIDDFADLERATKLFGDDTHQNRRAVP